MNINWDDMRYFLALCRNSSFVAASNELKVTHTTVARRISVLESSLQTQLFLRTEKGCALTPAGEKLLPYAEQLESTVVTFSERVAGTDNNMSGSIRICAPDGIGTCLLAPWLSKLQKVHPALVIELIAIPMYYSLSKREIDILITVQKPTHTKVVARKLTNYRLGLFATREYLDCAPEIKNRNDLRNHRFVGYIDDLLFDQDLNFMDEIHSGLSSSFRSSTVVAQLNAVAAGAGIGVIPYFMTHTVKKLVPVLPDHDIEKAYWLQVNPDSRQLARVRTTIDFIVDQIKRNERLFLSFSKR